MRNRSQNIPQPGVKIRNNASKRHATPTLMSRPTRRISTILPILFLLLIAIITSLLYSLYNIQQKCFQNDNQINRETNQQSLFKLLSHKKDLISPEKDSNQNATPNQHNEEHDSNWPSVAVEGVGYPLVKKGSNFVSTLRTILYQPKQRKIRRKKFSNLMEEFVHVYKNRPDKTNLCGIRFNHALALFVSIRHLNPRTVIESGVNAGQSTYFIRHAKKDMEVIAIDPEDEPICGEKGRWIDDSGNTKYYTGKNFRDLTAIDWVGMANNGTITPSRTLVFLDDHQEVIQRLPALMKAGISHVVVEDNYKRGEGATSMDRDGQTPKQLFAYRRKKDNGTLRDADWLYNNLISYAEFPPLVPPIMSRKFDGTRKEAGGFMFHNDTNIDIVPPLLRSDLDNNDNKLYESIATTLGYDPELKDNESYMQFMNYNQICYMELLPMAWRIVNSW